MCNCIEEVNQKLKEMTDNTILDIPFSLSFDGKIKVARVRISTAKRDGNSRKKPISVQPAFCPFCGKAYDEEVSNS